jgi:hypothetical protein
MSGGEHSHAELVCKLAGESRLFCSCGQSIRCGFPCRDILAVCLADNAVKLDPLIVIHKHWFRSDASAEDCVLAQKAASVDCNAAATVPSSSSSDSESARTPFLTQAYPSHTKKEELRAECVQQLWQVLRISEHSEDRLAFLSTSLAQLQIDVVAVDQLQDPRGAPSSSSSKRGRPKSVPHCSESSVAPGSRSTSQVR